MHPDSPPALSRRERPRGEPAFGPFFKKDSSYMRNVFLEKWPSVVKVVLMAGMVLFAMIRWA